MKNMKVFYSLPRLIDSIPAITKFNENGLNTFFNSNLERLLMSVESRAISQKETELLPWKPRLNGLADYNDLSTDL